MPLTFFLPLLLPTRFSRFFSSLSLSVSHQPIYYFRIRKQKRVFAMKGKSRSIQIGKTLPEWWDKFLSYKELKKKLKLIEPKSGERLHKRLRLDENSGDGCGKSKEEADFIKLLEDELEKFNSFFVEKEEEYIIRLKELKDAVAKEKDCSEEMIKIRKEIVDFHGEMVLFENDSALKYTGLVKILKKYDKRTGALTRLPFIQRVLQQPLYTTDLLYKQVKDCEAMLDHLFPQNEKPASASDSTETAATNGDCRCIPSTSSSSTSKAEDLLRMPREVAGIECTDSLHMESTASALR